MALTTETLNVSYYDYILMKEPGKGYRNIAKGISN